MARVVRRWATRIAGRRNLPEAPQWLYNECAVYFQIKGPDRPMYRIIRPYVLLLFITGTLFGQTKAEQTVKRPARSRPAVTHIGKHRLGETFGDWLVIEKIDIASSADQHLTHIQETGDGEASIGNGYGTFSWTFHDSKLESAMAGFEVEQVTEQITFLKQTYGSPSKISYVSVQNGFGAKWTDPVAIWNMPDGTGIELDVNRDVNVLFVRFYHRQPNASPSNPYK